MLMRDNFLLLLPKVLQVITMNVWLCSHLTSVYNSQSSGVVVQEMVTLCGTTPRKAFLWKHDNFL